METYSVIIEGVERQAVYFNPTESSVVTPLVICLHGHGGTAIGFAKKGFHNFWASALTVYPQGLQTPSHTDETAKNTGWQHQIKEIDLKTGIIDKDIKFFESILEEFKYRYSSRNVFVHGWSNGAEFLYDVLWHTNGSQIKALCGASAILNSTINLIPRRMMHIAGLNDPYVEFRFQSKAIEEVKKLNECSLNSSIWFKNSEMIASRYSSKIYRPVTFIRYDGGHAYPDITPELIMTFFQNKRKNSV